MCVCVCGLIGVACQELGKWREWKTELGAWFTGLPSVPVYTMYRCIPCIGVYPANLARPGAISVPVYTMYVQTYNVHTRDSIKNDSERLVF